MKIIWLVGFAVAVIVFGAMAGWTRRRRPPNSVIPARAAVAVNDVAGNGILGHSPACPLVGSGVRHRF
jgi:hypothetical protein